MATPKKLYHVEGGTDLSSCRICGSVVDQHYCKNLFGNTGWELLNLVEEIHGTVLTRPKLCLHLLLAHVNEKLETLALLLMPPWLI